MVFPIKPYHANNMLMRISVLLIILKNRTLQKTALCIKTPPKACFYQVIWCCSVVPESINFEFKSIDKEERGISNCFQNLEVQCSSRIIDIPKLFFKKDEQVITESQAHKFEPKCVKKIKINATFKFFANN